MATGIDMLKESLDTLQSVAGSTDQWENKLSPAEIAASAETLKSIASRVQALTQRVTLRAKGSDNLAHPVTEAIERLRESGEALAEAEAGSHEDAGADFKADLEALDREVGALEEAVRSRTVIVT
jgi:ubiquinone biosynthesis protein UbiJ